MTDTRIKIVQYLSEARDRKANELTTAVIAVYRPATHPSGKKYLEVEHRDLRDDAEDVLQADIATITSQPSNQGFRQ